MPQEYEEVAIKVLWPCGTSLRIYQVLAVDEEGKLFTLEVLGLYDKRRALRKSKR